MLLGICAAAGFSQVKVNITVDESKTVNVLTSATIGTYTQISDGNWLNPQVLPLLRIGGFTSIRYPGGYDGQADLYHWSTNKGVKWGNSDPPKLATYPQSNDFGHFAQFAEQLGTAIITVNYGSNAAGTGGGEPSEAAAWVAYANGDPNTTTVIGKDSSGFDWKTVGYWAALRAASPLSSDDGYNFLRISHPKPFNVRLWEIGNEVYNNGWFGANHATETDLHAPYPPNQKDNDKRRKNPDLSPSFYGARLQEFAKAMKAVDPGVMIGASLTVPPSAYTQAPTDIYSAPSNDYAWGGDWDADVLKAACQQIDFVSLHWHPGKTLPPDWKMLDEGSLFSEAEGNLPKIVNELVHLYGRSCPAGHVPRIAITELSPISWGKTQTPVVNALFSAEVYAILAEMGTINTDWYQLHENGLLTDDNKPLPPYYGVQMLHIIAHAPGDTFVVVSSNNSSVAAFATRRRDGLTGVMLINKDPKTAANVQVTLNGAQSGTEGLRFEYGPEQVKANAPMTKTNLTGLGSSFPVAVPAYSIVDLLLLPPK